jgi:hypothetical protein
MERKERKKGEKRGREEETNYEGKCSINKNWVKGHMKNQEISQISMK